MSIALCQESERTNLQNTFSTRDKRPIRRITRDVNLAPKINWQQTQNWVLFPPTSSDSFFQTFWSRNCFADICGQTSNSRIFSQISAPKNTLEFSPKIPGIFFPSIPSPIRIWRQSWDAGGSQVSPYTTTTNVLLTGLGLVAPGSLDGLVECVIDVIEVR